MMTSCSDSNRPKHSNLSAFVRSLQLSGTHLFIFVEGNVNDPYFYASLCSTLLSGTDISFKIRSAKQIPDPSSGAGKTALISLFQYLSETSELLNEFKGKKTGFLFFLDKDIDDLLNKQITSEHVLYTYYFDIENHIVEHGDLNKGCAVAASMDPQEIASSFGDPNVWLKDMAHKWKDWVKFCAFVQISNIGNCPLNYGRPSQFNEPLTGGVNKTDYEEKLAILKAESGLSEFDFAAQFDRISCIIDDFYQKGEHGKVFKGKWYSVFLAEHIKQLTKTSCGNVSGIEKQILRHIAGTLDFKATWTDYFTKPLKKIIDKLGPIDRDSNTLGTSVQDVRK